MFERTLDLIASENILSPLSRLFLISKYSEKYYLSNDSSLDMDSYTYPIDKNWTQILEAGKKSINEIFESTWNDQRALSGTHAMLCLLGALTDPGDVIIISPESVGGHFATQYIAKRLGLKIYYNEYSEETYSLNPLAIQEMVQNVKPKLITIDVSHQLFPHPVSEFRKIAYDDTIITYDASHVLGLLAGGELQKPLREGADLIHGSTHKTFPGTQKAIFVGTNERIKELIDKTIFPQFSSNNHLHHILANYAAFLEMKVFGKDYARQIVKNAKALARELYMLDLPVMAKEKDFTETHQVWIDTDHKFIHTLNEFGIRTTSFYIPGTDCKRRGIRLGTNVITKLGFKEKDMKVFAEFIFLALEGKISANKLRRKINDYVRDNEKLDYSFNNLYQLEKQGRLGQLLLNQIEVEGLHDIFKSLVDINK